jgi:hypothetical protein
MHCSSCGNSIKKGLKFCNSCGERVGYFEDDKESTPGKMLDNILTALFLIVMFGLGILVGLVAVLLGNNVQTELVGIIVVAYLAALFGICFMLAKQVPKLIDAKLSRINPTTAGLSPEQLRPITTAQLGEYREPVMSVTDNTTRTLQDVPRREGNS